MECINGCAARMRCKRVEPARGSEIINIIFLSDQFMYSLSLIRRILLVTEGFSGQREKRLKTENADVCAQS